MVTLLTSTGNRELDAGRMPGTNTSNLAETLVGLARKLLGVPTASDTLETVTLGDTDNVDELVLVEDLLNGDLLLEVLTSEVNLLGDGTTVELDLDDVGLLVAATEDLLLGVRDDADGRAVLLDLGKVGFDGLLAFIILPLLGGLGKRTLLGLVPRHRIHLEFIILISIQD
uniref:Uncharacterized protein n=1 Tax=Panagrellus redivivus TaxID=6233 RepID=A0A7E4UWW7_PANRE